MAKGAFAVDQVNTENIINNPISSFIISQYLFIGCDNGTLLIYERLRGIIQF